MNRLKIAFLAGGDSSEREIALQSAAQIEAALDPGKYDVTVIDVRGRDWHYTAPDGRRWQLDRNDFSLTVDGCRREFDYALILIHGTPGEDGKLQGYLDIMGIPYSSCSMTSSVITFDKISTKRAVAVTGVGLARERFIRRGDAVDPDALAAELGLPLFVKPNASGSSFGVTRVERAGEIPTAVERAFAESDEVLVEECIRGREMGCGVLIAGGREYLLPITEIRPKKEFFDFQAKYEAGYSDEITPAEIAPQTAAELHRLALAAYKACRCRGIVRVDFIVTPEGRPYLIEINTIPGMSAGSIVPKQVRAAGMTLGELGLMVNGERWLPASRTCDLTVIPCKNYTHQTLYKLPIPPSPNLPNMKSIYLYPSTCYFEATPVSLGRGTDLPFQVYGHPNMTGYSYSFTPRSVPGAKNPPQLGKLCHGVNLSNMSDEEIWKRGIDLSYVIDAYRNLNMDDHFFRSFFELLIGTDYVRKMIKEGKSAEEIKARWKDDVEKFKVQRKPYLLYEE